MTKKTEGLWAWHVHHEVLVEMLTEPIESCIAYIKSNKPKSEQATRLRLLRVVKDQAAYDSARATYAAAVASARATYAAAVASARATYVAAYDSARATYVAAYDSAWATYAAAYASARATYVAAVASAWESSGFTALHRKECPDCPWDGTTIFPAVPA